MTMHAISAAKARLDQRTYADQFVSIGRLLMAAKGDLLWAAEQAVNDGVPGHVARILQDNVGSHLVQKADAGTATGDSTESPSSWGANLAYANLAASFLASLREASVFDAALPFMRRAPLRTRMLMVETGAVGYIVGEGTAKTPTGVLSDTVALEPKKAACTVVVSADLLKFGGEFVDAVLGTELRDGVVAATDAEFVSDVVGDTTPISSSNNFLYDLQLALDAIEGGAGSRYFAAMAPANLKKLATTSGTNGRAFSELGVGGGTVGGITILPSDGLQSDEMLVFDATQIAADGGTLALNVSRHGNIDMAGGDTPAFSLWQKNCAAMRAERFFGFSLLRSTAAASLDGVVYSSDSPA